MDAEDIKFIDAAVSSVAHRLDPEDRFDLRQELALRLLESVVTDNKGAWLREVAFNWVADFLRKKKRHNELLHELHSLGAPRPYRKTANWEPTWYPPHKDAIEHPWLACEGARVMHVKAPSHVFPKSLIPEGESKKRHSSKKS